MKRRVADIAAFSLVEVTLALGIAAFSLIAIFGLLPVGIKSGQTAVDQTDANRIIAAVAADLRATPPGQSITRQYSLSIPSSGATGSATLYFDADGVSAATLQPRSLYLLTLTFPRTAGGRAATLADLKVSWPAPVALANASGFVETLVALDRN